MSLSTVMLSLVVFVCLCLCLLFLCVLLTLYANSSYLLKVKFWSQHISFILVGIIIVTSIRGLLITLTKVPHALVALLASYPRVTSFLVYSAWSVYIVGKY